MSHFDVSLIVWAESQDSVHKPQFLKRKESRSGSNRGPSAYQPSALPLGHTGSQSVDTIAHPFNLSSSTSFSQLGDDLSVLTTNYHLIGQIFPSSPAHEIHTAWILSLSLSLAVVTCSRYAFRHRCEDHTQCKVIQST